MSQDEPTLIGTIEKLEPPTFKRQLILALASNPNFVTAYMTEFMRQETAQKLVSLAEEIERVVDSRE